jgi:hypothetical protein
MTGPAGISFVGSQHPFAQLVELPVLSTASSLLLLAPRHREFLTDILASFYIDQQHSAALLAGALYA